MPESSFSRTRATEGYYSRRGDSRIARKPPLCKGRCRITTEGLFTKRAVEAPAPTSPLRLASQSTSPKVRGFFGRIVNYPYGLFFNFAFCILHFAFFITRSPSTASGPPPSRREAYLILLFSFCILYLKKHPCGCFFRIFRVLLRWRRRCRIRYPLYRG